ncbi:hypothetical protein BGX21_006151 [Mortierella sp. AD011]|nr:hypothetical protein BGX20_004777 [Mortierella sp. AD010]KAF9399494.1 hypothetical protein BGX21_006151 [Mortierella sp. AD011]
MLLVNISMFTQAIHEIRSAEFVLAQVIGSLAMGTAWLVGLAVNYNEHKYTIRSSDLLLLYYIVSITTIGITLHTQFDLLKSNQAAFHCNIASLVALLFGLLIESYPRGSTRVQQQSGAQEYEKANLWSRLTFTFFQPIVTLAAKQHILVPSDIVNQLPDAHNTKSGYTVLSTHWFRRVKSYRDKVQSAEKNGCSEEEIKKIKKPSLMATIFIAHWKAIVPIIIMRILIPFTDYLSPALLGLLLDYIGGDTSDESSAPAFISPKQEEKPLTYGLAIAFSMFAVHVITTMMYGFMMRGVYLLSVEIRSSLVAMIYRKALRLSPDARRMSSTGSITNHMSVDAAMWEEGVDTLSIWISLPFSFSICLLMLYMLLGWSFLAGLFTLLALVPLQVWRAKVFEGLEDERLNATDERVRLTSEILSNSKVIKLYGWESAFKRKILAARNLELGILRNIGAMEALMSVVFASSTVLVGLVTFAVYVTLGDGVLTPKVVFVSFSLFQLLHEPVGRMAEGTSDTISLVVATKRIQRFLFREEINDTQDVRAGFCEEDSRNVVEIRDATMAWTLGRSSIESSDDEDSDVDEEREDEQPLLSEHVGEAAVNGGLTTRATLRNINLTIQEGAITIVVGRVGQGKSSLLSTIIGEMYKLHGVIRVRGKVAYVPQQAWIINATLRDNILFGSAFNQERYRQVLETCGLEPDLAVLPAGDMTEIGERGINLSGGQKQRVSLARAAYQDADIYLLDDPLSAVDAHVDRHLWENLIGPKGILKDKARVLVTHGIHHLEHVDQIVVVKEGEIAEVGRYEDLMAAKQSFYQLIEEYSTKRAGKRRGSHATHRVDGLGNQPSSKSDEPSLGGSIDGNVDSDSVTIEDTSVDALNKTNTQTRDRDAEGEDEEDMEDELIADEVMKKGGVEWRLVKNYARAFSLKASLGMILICMVTQLCTIGFSLWMKYWISKTKEDLEESLVLFLGVYSAMVLVYVVFFILFVHLALAVGRIRASEKLHRLLISTVIRLPMSFFDTTPLGRILNRFSSDMYSVDEHLGWKTMDMTYITISVTSTLVVIAATTPAFVFMIPIIALVFYFIANWFLWATRSLKRINSVSLSPLYQHFDESLNGVSTIRAMEVQQQFIEESDNRTDYHANAYTAYMYCNRWVDFRLQVLSAFIILVVALSGVFARNTIDASLIGLSLSFAIAQTDEIMWICKDFTEWQSHLVAIERIQEYTDKHTEAPETSATVIPESWPEQGRIEFQNFSARYREGLDLVIKHLSFEIQPCEKIGIVGRTGAGKSSITLALFRIIEAANSPWARASDNAGYHERVQGDGGENEPLLMGHPGFHSQDGGDEDEEMDGGSIKIDGIDISTLGLTELRKHLAIIPQDPTLFAGSIRDNLDPFQEVPDSALWEALERAHLKDHIRSLPGGLSTEVAQNGENFSVGQRSLICLARALLRKSKILILDEATASVDVETDELIQQTIRKEFQDRTILTIAHRIKTVMDSTKILVMDRGEVVEFDPPEVLLQKPESLFFKLAHQSGEATM